jgi:hypothetical protein
VVFVLLRTQAGSISACYWYAPQQARRFSLLSAGEQTASATGTIHHAARLLEMRFLSMIPLILSTFRIPLTSISMLD